MKIGILCPYRFPQGMAPTTRIIAYCKGLRQNGVETEVVSFDICKSREIDRLDGVVEGTPYHIPYIFNPEKYDRKLYRVLYANWKHIFSCVHELVDSHKRKPFDIVLLSFDDPKYMLVYSIFLRLHGIKLGFIGDEFPEPIRQLKKTVPRWQIDLFKLIYMFISLRVVMTRALGDWYNSNISEKPTWVFSSVIDTDRFSQVEKQPVNRPYLCYMGNLMLAKDNVDNIVRAFALIADDFPEYDLHLYGTPNEKDKNYIENIIEEGNLTNRVFLKGRASYDDVPQILANAKVLVTSQPNTIRATGGFPTKMCEYMMSGVPTILTDVGEIHEYVTDGVNAFMVEACNPEQYAERLKWILNHYDESLEVAHNAKDYIISTFGSKNATKELMQFLSEYTKEN